MKSPGRLNFRRPRPARVQRLHNRATGEQIIVGPPDFQHVTDEAPSCTHEDNGTALRAIKTSLDTWARREPPAPGEFLEAAKGVERGQMARAAVEMLLWDYRAKAEGRPLDEVLGASRGYAEAGIAVGLGREGEVRSRIGDALERGYKRIKVKIERKGAVEMLKGIRDSFPEVSLSADANGCFELRRDMAALKRIDKCGNQFGSECLAGVLDREHNRVREIVGGDPHAAAIRQIVHDRVMYEVHRQLEK